MPPPCIIVVAALILFPTAAHAATLANASVRFQGVVTLAPDASGSDFDFYIQDSTGGLMIRTRRHWPISMGDKVEVSGTALPARSVSAQNVVRLESGKAIQRLPVGKSET